MATIDVARRPAPVRRAALPGAIALATLAWIGVWALRLGEGGVTAVAVVTVVAAGGTVAGAVIGWILLGRPDRGAERFVAAAAVASTGAALAAILLPGTPLVLGAVWTIVAVASAAIVADADPERVRQFGAAVLLWSVGAAIWWAIDPPPGGIEELIWTPSDAVAYVRIADQLAEGRFEEVPYLLGVPLLLQPVVWALGSDEPAQAAGRLNDINQALLVPTAVLVVPAVTTLVGRTLATARGRSRDARSARGVVLTGAAAATAVLVLYASAPPDFAHARTAEMAARRITGTVFGPESISLLFAAAVLYLVSRATTGRPWNPWVVGVAIGVAPLVREFNAALGLLTLVLLATIPGEVARTLRTAGVAALTSCPR
jgi:hypothetical protein